MVSDLFTKKIDLTPFSRDFKILFDFVSYHYFDARQFPNLVELIKSQGVEPREPLEMRYRCKA